MKLNVTQISSSPFSHSLRRRLLIAEWSEIGLPTLQRLYDDAADVGLALRNPLTGNVTRWALREELRDGEHELIALILVPTPETCSEQPWLKGYEMHILND